MTWDIRGRRLTMVDPDMGAWSYDYNVLDELVGQTDAKLQTATLAYDLLGRMTTRAEPEGITAWAYDNAFKTAAIGKLDRVTRTQDDYVEDLFYDTAGRPVETTVTYEARDYTHTTTYDTAGRPATVTYPAANDASRFAVENGYNAQGYLELAREFGGAGTIHWQAMIVDAEGRVTEESLGNGLTTLRDYDPATGLPQTAGTYNGLTPLRDLAWDFDLLGNLRSRSDLLQGRDETFTYDNLNRLTGATVIDTATMVQLGQTTASYDPLGNITSKSDVGVYAYDGIAAGPHAVTQAGAMAYGYDANGSMISSTDTATATLVRDATWSSFNKPVRVQDFQRNQASLLTYGPSRARVKQVVYAGVSPVKTITYIGGFERHAFASGPDELVHYIRAGGTVAIYTKTDDSLPATDKTRYPHRDHLGSIDTVTDEAGAVTEARSYDPWGKTRNPDWTPAVGDIPLTETKRGFTDHEHLDAVGLIHMNGRVYDPVIGRFLSADPSDATDPRVGFNRYSYVGNNPLSFTDPTGMLLDTTKTTAIGVGLGIAALSLTPVGWAVVGVVAIGAAVAGCVAYCGDLFDEPVDVADEVDVNPATPEDGVKESEGKKPGATVNTPTTAGHRKGARKSTEKRHQHGEAAEAQGKGGEKGDKGRRPHRKKADKNQKGSWPPRKPPRKPPETTNPKDEYPKKENEDPKKEDEDPKKE